MKKNYIQKNIIPGCEEITLKGNKIGCILVHGFRSCPFEMKEYADYFHKEGFTVKTCLLPGHGTEPPDLLNIKWHDWVNSVNQSFESLRNQCDRIFISGLSTGGSLALYLATEQKNIDGIIALAPGLFLQRRSAWLAHILKYFWKFKKIKSDPDISIPVKSIVYPKVPVRIISELLKLFNALNKRLNDIEVPVLIVYSPKDHVVKQKSSIKIYNKISSSQKKLIRLKKSFHILTLDVERNIVFKESVDFIKDVLSS